MHGMALNKRFFSKGCPPHFIGVCQSKIYWRVVHIIIGVCPNEKISEDGPTFYWSLSKLTIARTKTKTFCFRNDFHTWKNTCVRESVRTRGIGAWHVTIM